LRLWFASMAYVLLCALRRIGLHETEYAKATCGTIRLKLLKIGALVRVSVRRIKVAMASACPAAQVWGLAAVRLVAGRWLYSYCRHFDHASIHGRSLCAPGSMTSNPSLTASYRRRTSPASVARPRPPALKF
jgi:Transposase DDE domain group 1